MSEKSCFEEGEQYKTILFALIGDYDDGNDESLSFLLAIFCLLSSNILKGLNILVQHRSLLCRIG